MTHVIERKSWAEPADAWNGELQGRSFGSNISLIFNIMHERGAGPRLHRHPYAETFIIRAGEALFTVGAKQIRAVPGQILIVPPNTPHKFENIGPEPLETIDIHESGKFVTEWLESPV